MGHLFIFFLVPRKDICINRLAAMRGICRGKKGQISDKCPGMEGYGHCVLGTKISDQLS